MTVRRLPVHPDLDQLHRQAKELLRDLPSGSKLADAQIALAREYGVPNWPRLVHAVKLADAIWRDDLNTVRDIVTYDPRLLHEDVLIRTDSNWGPPLTYAANLGRNEIILMLHRLGAKDLQSAAGRAALQGKVDTVHLIYKLAGSPDLTKLSLAGPAYTLSVEGT